MTPGPRRRWSPRARVEVALVAGALAALLGLSACAPALAVDGRRAYRRVQRQVEAGPRIPGTPGHAAVLAWLHATLDSLSARVTLQATTDSSLGRPLALTNVIAHYGPEGAPIVLCAHWDSRPFCDQDPDPAHRQDPVPGANDGGSGVAVLLEVAELLHRARPREPVDLVFFDGEDQGRADHGEEFCLGSRAYAQAVANGPPARKPVAAFLFDMVGDRDLGIWPEVQSAAKASNVVALVLQGARATGATHFHDAPKYELVDDHTRLMAVGIPAVDVVDFDYAAWHTHRDLPDQVSPASLAEVARVAAWIVTRSPLAAR
jgi:peptidase M28-like protein